MGEAVATQIQRASEAARELYHRLILVVGAAGMDMRQVGAIARCVESLMIAGDKV